MCEGNMLRAGFYQFRPLWGKVEQNRNKVLARLSAVEADLVVLPELAFTGYHFENSSQLADLAEEPKNSVTLEALSNLCVHRNLHIVTGFAEKQGDKIYNSAAMIGPQGLMGMYRKIHLFFFEKKLFHPGHVPPEIREVNGVKVGMMICFDWIFPEVARILSLRGADVICHPSNLVLDYCQRAMLTRCLENNVFAITANRFGTEKGPDKPLRFTGKSQIVAPRGKLLYRARAAREELVVTEIDPALARDKKMTGLNDLFSDRQPDAYREICRNINKGSTANNL